MDVQMYYCHNSVKGLNVKWCVVNEPRWAAAGVQQGEYIFVFTGMCITAVGCSQFPTPPSIRGKVSRA